MAVVPTDSPAVPAQAVVAKQPIPLTPDEKKMRDRLFTAGVLVILVVSIWFAASTDGTLTSKEIKTTEPVGESATGTKTTDETQYADSVVILGLGAGFALILAGTFYARLRTLKIGVIELGLEAPGDKTEEAATTAEDSARQRVGELADAGTEWAGTEQAEVLAVAARKLAAERVQTQWVTAPGLSDEEVRTIGEEAATELVEEASARLS